MSWSDVKIHKQAAPHLLQELRFADIDLSDGGAEYGGLPGGGEVFQPESARPMNSTPEDVPSSLPVENLRPQEEFVPVGLGLREQREEEFNGILGTLATSLEELGRLRENVMKNSTEDMLRMVLVIAEQIIHCEVKANPEVILKTLQEALQSAISSDEYHVKIHPDDLAIVVENKPLFLASVNGLKNITLEADGNVTRGGCLVESELGQVDATIEEQLEELRRQLLPELMVV